MTPGEESQKLTIRCTRSELLAWAEAANRAGLSTAAWAKRQLLAAAQSQIENPKSKIQKP